MCTNDRVPKNTKNNDVGNPILPLAEAQCYTVTQGSMQCSGSQAINWL